MATMKFVHDKQVGLKGRLETRDMPGNYVLHWGDGWTDRGTAEIGGKPTFHSRTFEKAGVYTAWVIIDGDTKPYQFVNYRVLATNKPKVTVSSAPDRDYTGRVAFDDDAGPVGRYTIVWKAPSTKEDVVGIPGTHVDHYFPAGDHRIQVQDHWSGLNTIYDFTIDEPVIDPDVTVAAAGYVATLEVTNSTGTDRKLIVDWDDGSATEEISAAVGTSVQHPYEFDGDYIVTATYADAADQWVSVPVTIPGAAS